MQALPDARQQSFEEIYGPPENFLEIEVSLNRRTLSDFTIRLLLLLSTAVTTSPNTYFTIILMPTITSPPFQPALPRSLLSPPPTVI